MDFVMRDGGAYCCGHTQKTQTSADNLWLRQSFIGKGKGRDSENRGNSGGNGNGTAGGNGNGGGSGGGNGNGGGSSNGGGSGNSGGNGRGN